MCNNNSPPNPNPNPASQSQIMKKKTQKKQNPKDFSSSSSSSSSFSKRRNRTKTRKPKFLSLRLQLSQTQPDNPTQQHKPPTQLNNLFPDDRDMHEDNNDVALLFASDAGATLTGLLEDDSTTTTTATAATMTSEERSPSASAMTCPPAMEGLVRRAMRKGREEVESEERWVCYSEVVEEKKEMTEEVTSYSCDPLSRTASFGSLSLKLDHEGILNAWSDKGSLYVAAPADEAPQTVPDLFNGGCGGGGGVFLHNALPPNVAMWDGWGSHEVVGNTWKVPEGCEGNNKTTKVKEEMGWKLGQREASVQRYKEKRQNRLFAKRIRYEVRKLNAEKRPRMKGRFVKRE